MGHYRDVLAYEQVFRPGAAMKLGVNTLFYIPGEVGGSETYLLEILRQWKQTGQPQEVVLFTQLENHQVLSSEFVGEGWTCALSSFRASNRFVRILREQMELPFRVRKFRPDVLWSPGYTSPIFTACPQAVTIHDMQYKYFPEDMSRLARFITDVLVQACALLPRKHIITISNAAKNDILRFTRAKPDRITVVSEAANRIFSPATENPEAATTPFLLCVANSYPHKALDTLVSAFSLLEDEIPHDLIIVGKPRRGEEAVRKAAGCLKNANRLKRVCGLNRKELVRLYQRADLFVLPSRYEGFGLPVLEAMQSGVPVLTTRCGSIPEVGGDAVWYADPNDVNGFAGMISRCINAEPEERARRVREGLRRAQEFSWARTAEATREVLESLAGH
jgi:glycosyltransferase involved in cell wall biosynthesis